MRKSITFLAALTIGAVAVFAQEPYDYTGRWYVSAQGGPLISINENHFSYKDNAYLRGLLTWQGSLAVGYDIMPELGVRLSVGYGNNAAAANVKQTNYSDNGVKFFPYNFKSVNVFADAILNVHGLSEDYSAFSPKFYAGLGYAHSFNPEKTARNVWKDSDAIHPWQPVYDHNNVFGFRLGFIVEYNFRNGIGLFADLCGEA